MTITRAKTKKQLTGNKKKKPKGFKAVQKSIERSGKSPEAAARIAYHIGVKKYGKQNMAKKAAAGRKRKAKTRRA
jgi:hypothetical protein